MATREPITASFNNADLLRVMAEGDERAATIAKGILQDPFLGGHKALLKLDDMNIRGKQLVAAFDYCGSQPSLLGCLMTGDTGMLNHVNATVKDEVAVTSGASFKRAPGR